MNLRFCSRGNHHTLVLLYLAKFDDIQNMKIENLKHPFILKAIVVIFLYYKKFLMNFFSSKNREFCDNIFIFQKTAKISNKKEKKRKQHH
jgi:hypothetical protein